MANVRLFPPPAGPWGPWISPALSAGTTYFRDGRGQIRVCAQHSYIDLEETAAQVADGWLRYPGRGPNLGVGPTSARPTDISGVRLTGPGPTYYDTDIGALLIFDGAGHWLNAIGVAV
jgi:hypothetical protein